MKKFIFTILFILTSSFVFAADDEPYKILVGPVNTDISMTDVTNIIKNIITNYALYGGIIRPSDSEYGLDYKLKIIPTEEQENTDL